MADQLSSTQVDKDQLTIVIPVKNEEAAISQVIDELQQEGYKNIIVVDGYSTDNTKQIVEKKGGVEFIHQHGGGKTGAVKTAIEHVKTPYLLLVDGDFTYPAQDIWRLLAHGKNYAEVIGVRDRTHISPLHRIGNRVITSTFNLMFGAHISDVCSGLYLLKTDVAKELELRSNGFITEVEIAAQMAAHHNITEVPIGYRKRIGQGKLTAWNGFSILGAVIKLSWKYNPVLLFSTIASTVSIPALIILGWVVYRQYAFGVWHSGWVLVGVLLLLFATQSIALAAMSALMKRMEQRITQRITKKEQS